MVMATFNILAMMPPPKMQVAITRKCLAKNGQQAAWKPRQTPIMKSIKALYRPITAAQPNKNVLANSAHSSANTRSGSMPTMPHGWMWANNKKSSPPPKPQALTMPPLWNKLRRSYNNYWRHTPTIKKCKKLACPHCSMQQCAWISPKQA